MIQETRTSDSRRRQQPTVVGVPLSTLGLRDIIWQTIQGWLSDRALSMGASLAFYTTFSMTPLLLIVISIAGIWFGDDVARNAVVGEFEHLAGPAAAQSVGTLLLNAHLFGPGIIGIALGLFTFFVSATAAFIELQDDLNAILRAEPPPLSRYWIFLRQRLISLAMIMAIGFLLIVSLAIDAGVTAFDRYLDTDVVSAYVAIMAVGGNLIISIILFSLIFRFLPTIRLPWRPILAGATLTSVTFLIGKFLIGFYLGQSHVASAFGAAASLITILLWVYYSSQILLFGAEFIATICGRRIAEEPQARAQRMTRHRPLDPPARTATHGRERGSINETCEPEMRDPMWPVQSPVMAQNADRKASKAVEDKAPRAQRSQPPDSKRRVHLPDRSTDETTDRPGVEDLPQGKAARKEAAQPKDD